MTDAPRHGRRLVRPQLGRATWQRTRRAVLARDAWTCRYCGGTARVVDHIIPAQRYPGRHDDPDNLVAACVSCNNSKRGMSLEEWFAAAGEPLPSWWLARAGGGREGGYRFALHHHRTGSSGGAGVMLIGRMASGIAALDHCPPDCPWRAD